MANKNSQADIDASMPSITTMPINCVIGNQTLSGAFLAVTEKSQKLQIGSIDSPDQKVFGRLYLPLAVQTAELISAVDTLIGNGGKGHIDVDLFNVIPYRNLAPYQLHKRFKLSLELNKGENGKFTTLSGYVAKIDGVSTKGGKRTDKFTPILLDNGTYRTMFDFPLASKSGGLMALLAGCRETARELVKTQRSRMTVQPIQPEREVKPVACDEVSIEELAAQIKVD